MKTDVWPHLCASSLTDVSDLCEGKSKDQGGSYEQSEPAARDGRRWLEDAVTWAQGELKKVHEA